MPPPRGKSCAACTKAKRRCDFALPACLRCSARGIECQYPQRTRSSLVRVAHPAARRGSTPVRSESPPAQEASPDLFCSGWPFTDEMLTVDTSSVSLHGKDIESAFPGSGLPWDAGGRDMSAGLFSPEESDPNCIIGDRGLSEREHAREPTMKPPITVSSHQDGLTDILAERLRYGAKYLDRISRTLVETMGTPWCHREVFKRDVPKDIKDMLACSALYMAKTPENEPFVLKTLISNLTELAKSPIPTTHTETLARAHVLGMYHVMALFDGDIEARASAESSLPQLERACDALVPHIAYDDLSESSAPTMLPLFPLASTESFWRTWILQESTRRTWLFTNQLILMYAFLTKRKSSVSAGDAQCRSWCLAGRLWRAGNAVDFAAAWGEGRRLVATMHRLDEVFREARPGDLDEFGKMLLTCYMGEQEARGWMSVRGGCVDL